MAKVASLARRLMLRNRSTLEGVKYLCSAAIYTLFTISIARAVLGLGIGRGLRTLAKDDKGGKRQNCSESGDDLIA